MYDIYHLPYIWMQGTSEFWQNKQKKQPSYVLGETYLDCHLAQKWQETYLNCHLTSNWQSKSGQNFCKETITLLRCVMNL